MKNRALISNCYQCALGITIHHHPETDTWMVPSRDDPWTLYAVRFHRIKPLAYSCGCRWGSSERTRGMCFHARAALSQHPEVRPLIPALAIQVHGELRMLQIALQERESYPDDETLEQVQALREVARYLRQSLTHLTTPQTGQAPAHAGDFVL